MSGNPRSRSTRRFDDHFIPLTEAGVHRRPSYAFTCLALASVLILGHPVAAAAAGFSLSAIGGSATGTTGRVGDTLIVGIDLLLSDGDFVTIADPVLQWDMEGGNVLDARSAAQSSLTIDSFQLNPISADVWRIGDPTNGYIRWWGSHRGDPGVLSRGSAMGDSRVGPSFLWGFEQVSTILDADGMLVDILASGVSGAGSFRIGTVEFVLREPGITTISYLLDDRFPFRTLIAGSQAQFAPSREIGLEPLTVSSSVFSALQITVVPEPTTALLMALGLLGLSRLGRKV